jgi:ubiquinone/menaquinone biosynthesis C-methylase UbiE
MSSERQLLNEKDPWWGEHVHRYNEVLPFIDENDNLLDLACGTGFGSDNIATHTKGIVIGGDIAPDAIRECNSNWHRPNLSFKVLDGTKLPFEDCYFDKIISFETIEHTTKYREMLREFFRVLKYGGIAFISTPNFLVNSPTGKVTNPYHTQEFTYQELKELLDSVFKDVIIYGQKFSRYDNGRVSRFGKIIYGVFNIIGVRKFTPYKVKNSVYKFFTGKPFYPVPDDFILVDMEKEILKCKTFFCICRK